MYKNDHRKYKNDHETDTYIFMYVFNIFKLNFTKFISQLDISKLRMKKEIETIYF